MFYGAFQLQKGGPPTSGSSSDSSSVSSDEEILYPWSTVAQYSVFLHVERNLNSQRAQNVTISVAEMRLLLLDRCPADNSLLDDFEWSDAEIAFAIQRSVDLWNETLPQIANYQYTAATFPYRYHWMDGCAGELLIMAGRRISRNRLDFDAGGVSIQDRARGVMYLQLGQQMLSEYKQWITLEKGRINAENCYGRVQSNVYF